MNRYHPATSRTLVGIAAAFMVEVVASRTMKLVPVVSTHAQFRRNLAS